MDQARHQLNPTLSKQENNPEVIRREIKHTRAEIGDTVNMLQDRLSPEKLKHEVKIAAKEKLETVKENVRITAERWQWQAAERIINNPIPVAMVGVGLVWLLKQASSTARVSDRRSKNYYSLDAADDWPDYDPKERAGRISHDYSDEQGNLETIKAKAQKSGRQAREQISEWTNHAQESLHAWKDQASEQSEYLRERGERAKGEFQRYFQNHPLTVGGVTLAIGAAVGLSLPHTQKEDQWLGETRDRLLDQAKATAKEILPKTKEFVDEITQAGRESIKEHMSERAI